MNLCSFQPINLVCAGKQACWDECGDSGGMVMVEVGMVMVEVGMMMVEVGMVMVEVGMVMVEANILMVPLSYGRCKAVAANVYKHT
jgi:hypothetical protein